MALDYFRIERGLELDDLVLYLQGNGAPGTGDSATAPIGSVYTDNSTGDLYTKIASGWSIQASQAYVNNAVGATISWREPAVVRDNAATTVPTGTATQPIVIDGVSITDGQRVLFSAIVGGSGPNVYVYNQAAGLFVDDTNLQTNGDALYIQAGTSAGKTYVYNGSAWVQSDQSSLDEEGYIRAFAGKSGVGNVLPTYTSTNFAVQSSNLTVAISALDAELGANVATGNFISSANKINGNLQALDTEIGANVSNGGFITAAHKINQNIQALDTQLGVALLAGNFITAGQSVSGALTTLDAELGPNVSTGNFVAPANKINQNIQALDTQLGANVTSTTSTGGSILSTASTNANIQAVDAAVALTSKETAATNVTTLQTIDTVAAGLGAKWLVRCVLASDATRVYATEIYSVTDGTNIDYTRYGTLRLGTSISGLAVTVAVDGGGNMLLQVASTSAVNVTARRVGVMV